MPINVTAIPGLPDHVVAILRRAFDATMQDPAFLAEAEKLQLQVDKPTSGEKLQAQIGRVYQMPQRVIDRLRRIAQGG